MLHHKNIIDINFQKPDDIYRNLKAIKHISKNNNRK